MTDDRNSVKKGSDTSILLATGHEAFRKSSKKRNNKMSSEKQDVGADIIAATTDVFTTMLMVEIQAGDVIQGQGGEVVSNITSMLGLGGDIRGMLAVHCPEGVAKGITSGFLGMDVEELDDDVKDAIGEIANMVAGNLKVAFSEHDVNIELAIPTSVIGKSYRTSGMLGAERVAVPFIFNSETFLVELKYVVNEG